MFGANLHALDSTQGLWIVVEKIRWQDARLVLPYLALYRESGSSLAVLMREEDKHSTDLPLNNSRNHWSLMPETIQGLMIRPLRSRRWR